ncbi:MAG: GIY-YIG nuclease family protein [Candidatus Niyogibacteria bacterium]|nr:GIY-YIG nuclease family protein [Candidatus Niyogibacteria bacterium]
MKYVVYAISSLFKNYIYVGQTSNLERRLKQHNEGQERTTRPYKPFKLIHKEECTDRPSARLREKFLKSGVGKEFLKNL